MKYDENARATSIEKAINILMTRMDAFRNYQNSSFVGRAINVKEFLEPLLRKDMVLWDLTVQNS